ncbi:MAG: hypothetical protein HC845_15985 [Akkermansiaceae bacterium]|nr:hypothetical protein [Akkermansiaceae bacterium]
MSNWKLLGRVMYDLSQAMAPTAGDFISKRVFESDFGKLRLDRDTQETQRRDGAG